MDQKNTAVHPGKILQEKFLEPLNLNQNQLAIALHVPPRRINEIILQKRRITADTALRLARYFKNKPEYWLGLQMDHDLSLAEKAAGEKIEKEVTPRS